MPDSPPIWKRGTPLHKALLVVGGFPVENLIQPPCMEIVGGGLELSKRLHIRDVYSGLVFLVDTGAEQSLIPVGDNPKSQRSGLKLYAANSTPIDTFGEKRLVLNFRLRRPIAWNFCIAAVPYPIIRADLTSSSTSESAGLLIRLRVSRLSVQSNPL